nr:hypothetical protein [uncultured Cohaesibacter sp.]
MPKYISVRPHLLDETEIETVILQTGMNPHDRGLIVDFLVENYAVDLDLLASVFASLDHIEALPMGLPEAA